MYTFNQFHYFFVTCKLALSCVPYYITVESTYERTVLTSNAYNDGRSRRCHADYIFLHPCLQDLIYKNT